MSTWCVGASGVLTLPSGRLVRGRGLRRPQPHGAPPEFAVYLLKGRPELLPWEVRWVRWPDFWLPTDHQDAQLALREAWRRATTERVELACSGGRGRTGTALACLAVLDGRPATEAVAYVREHYDLRAVETPCQRRYVARFPCVVSGVPVADRPRGRPASWTLGLSSALRRRLLADLAVE